MIQFNKKWLISTSLAFSYPSTLLGLAFVLKKLTDFHYISQTVAVIIFFLVTIGILVQIVFYAFQRKNKS